MTYSMAYGLQTEAGAKRIAEAHTPHKCVYGRMEAASDVQLMRKAMI